jgi:tRNA nucleotidyltransferase/poly(A) polymerase
MTRVFVSLLLVIAIVVPSASFAQDRMRAEQSSQVLQKVRELQLLNQILPVLMTDEQYDELFPVIEENRENIRMLEAREAEVLQELEPAIEEALEKAREEGVVPSAVVISKIDAAFSRLTMARTAMLDFNAGRLVAKMNEILNEGQIKAAANSLDRSLLGGDPDEMTQDEKLEAWVRNVLMDPLAYDLMVDLSRL